MTTPTSQDARESALERLIEKVECDADTMLRHGLDCVTPATRELARGRVDNDLDLAASARAELSALRASPPSVAMEFVEAADDLIAALRHVIAIANASAWDCDNGSQVRERDEVMRRATEAGCAYAALRPTATGEAISADDLRDAFIEGWHASAEELDEPYDAKKALAAWAESASKHDARAAIARAEGRKGT